MKILMIGLGSIGQRHVRNIRSLLGDSVEIIAYRERGLKGTFNDELELCKSETVEEKYNIVSYYDLDEALSCSPDIVFVTNITSKHMIYAIKCAKAGCNLFIEKPLSDSVEGLDELREWISKRKLKVFVGFQNRYHPCIRYIKDSIINDSMGRILYVETDYSENLKTIHKYENYKEMYISRKEMGGGPILNLLIHDLDILYFLFGYPYEITASIGTFNYFDIDVEEVMSAIFKFSDGNNHFFVHSHTDFYQNPAKHSIKIVGSKSTIVADLNSFSLSQYDENNVKTTDFSYVRNDLFVAELKTFFEWISERKFDDIIDFESGSQSLNMALSIKEAAITGKTIRILK